MLDFFKKLAYSLKMRYEMWRHEKALDKYLTASQSVENYDYHQDAVKHAYAEGISKIKNKVNSASQEEGYHNHLATKQEILDYAEYENEESKKLAKALKEVFVYTKEKPQDQMINDRISQYYELQNHILKRRELRAKRNKNNLN